MKIECAFCLKIMKFISLIIIFSPVMTLSAESLNFADIIFRTSFRQGFATKVAEIPEIKENAVLLSWSDFPSRTVEWSVSGIKPIIFKQAIDAEFNLNFYVPNALAAGISQVCIRFLDSKGETFQFRSPKRIFEKVPVGTHAVKVEVNTSGELECCNGNKIIDWPLTFSGGLFVFGQKAKAGNIFLKSMDFVCKGSVQQNTVVFEKKDIPNIEAVVSAKGVGSVFTSSQKPEFELSCKKLKYRVEDWNGKNITSGTTENDKLELTTLPCGYYKLFVDNYRGFCSFTVVPDIADRRLTTNTFYAIDSAQNYHAKNIDSSKTTGDAQELIANLIQLAGITNVRDRFRWVEINPKPEVFNWNILPSRTTDLHNSRGTKVTGIFANSPSWTRTISPKLPDDLMALYRFTEALAKNYKGKVSCWEFWNEPDINFAPEPAWRYAACLKAAYMGYKSGDQKSEVLNGSLCTLPDNFYWECLLKNDLLLYCDIFNIHSYDRIGTYINGAHVLMKKYGFSQGKRIFITETSTNVEGATCKQYNSNLGKHSPEQEMLIAEVYPKKMLNLQSYGVERAYFFVMSPYNERGGHKDWGIMRRDGTVKPVYAALSNMNYLLNDAEYLGLYQLSDVQSGHLLERKDGTQILVFWSKSPVDDPDITHSNVDHMKSNKQFPSVLKMILPEGEYSLFDIFGKTTQIKGGENNFSCSRYPCYLVGKLNLKPTKLELPPSNTDALKKHGDLEVVLDAYVDPNDFNIINRKAVAAMKEQSGKIRLLIYNFSKEKKIGKFEVKGGKLEGLPAQLALPPWGKAEIQSVFIPNEGKEVNPELEITGTFNGQKITRLVIPMQITNRLYLDTISTQIANNASMWRKNSSGSLTISNDEMEKAVHFNCKFPERVLRWCFPEYILQPGESLKDAVGITFEVKSKQDKMENDFRNAGVFLVTDTKAEKGNSCFIYLPAPMEQWETRYVTLSDKLAISLPEVKMLRFGGAPKGQVLDMWIRNIRVFYKKTTGKIASISFPQPK